MSSEGKIRNITEASDAIAQFKPSPVALSDGATVFVHKLSWLDFEGIYAQLAGAINDYIEFTALSQQAEVKSLGVQLASEAVSQAQAQEVAEITVKAALNDANSAREAANSALSALVDKVRDAPELALQLVELTCREGRERTSPLKQRDELKDWIFDDVLACAVAAVQVNFIDNQRIADFFARVTGALGRAKT